jgi:hypothetical protein
VLQAAVGDGLSFDPFSFCQDGATPPVVDVGRGEIVDALVVSAVVVVGNEGFDLGFEIAGQEVIFQQAAGSPASARQRPLSERWPPDADP